MKYAIGYNEDGKILFAQSSPADIEAPVGLSKLDVTEGIYRIVAPHIGISPERFYVSAQLGTVVGIAERPSQYHSFNWTTKKWEEDLQLAQSAKRAEIDLERQRRNLLPIEVNEILLDADLVAQKNLADKLAGVKERIRLGLGMLPALMVWKDANNVVHSWASLQNYCDWLAGYVIALEDRGTRIYAHAWSLKAALETMTTVADVIALDVKNNWPS